MTPECTGRESVATATREQFTGQERDTRGSDYVRGTTTRSRVAQPTTRASSEASRSAVEAQFVVHNTPTASDPLHHTVELPKPVTRQIADWFNKLFGRD